MAPKARMTVITLGADDVPKARQFYLALGFVQKFADAGEEVAFFDAGGPVLALYGWDNLAKEGGQSALPRPEAFRGVTLAWNCSSREEVDAVLELAHRCGASSVTSAAETHYGGYAGYFTDPDQHLWEVVIAPGIVVGSDGRVQLPD
jgi:predicted lactoylglutathione lyase